MKISCFRSPKLRWRKICVVMLDENNQVIDMRRLFGFFFLLNFRLYRAKKKLIRMNKILSSASEK